VQEIPDYQKFFQSLFQKIQTHAAAQNRHELERPIQTGIR
jgi:hypothetical protein